MKKLIKITTVAAIFVGVFLLSGAVSFFMLQDNKLPTNTTEIKSTLIDFKNKLPRAYVVQSGSMEPAIQTGSLILSIPQTSYRSGDVLTFEKGNKLITHRAMYQEFTLEESYFMTKGDANEEADVQKVAESNIVGKVALSVPYLGYAADYAKQPKGFILLVIVPATIVIYEELKSLFKEIIKLIRRMKGSVSSKSMFSSFRPNTTSEEDDDSNSASGKAIKGAALLPIFGAVLAISAFSVGYFFDNESSIGNVFSAAESFDPSPTPTPGDGPTPTPTEGGPSPTPTQVEQETIDVVVNELMANPSGAESVNEWIELYNLSSTEVNLDNWTIEDTVGTTNIHALDGNIIPPNGFLVIERPDSGITLNNPGDGIELKFDGDLVDSLSFTNDTGEGNTYGRDPDGTGTGSVCTTSSKGSSNNGLCI